MTSIDYQMVSQAIRDGAAAATVEALLANDRAQLTDEQIQLLRTDLAARDAAPARNVQAAKAAVNHAQVVCAAAYGLPSDVNLDDVDECGGHEVFRALSRAYTALCDEERD